MQLQKNQRVALHYENKVRGNLDYVFHALSRNVPIMTICTKLDISRQQWRRYYEKYAEFKNVVDLAKQAKVELVENALYQRATGLTTTDIEVRQSDSDMGSTLQKIVRTKQHLPDVGAATFILKNRDPENWKDMQKVSHEGEVHMEIKLPVRPDQQAIEEDLD